MSPDRPLSDHDPKSGYTVAMQRPLNITSRTVLRNFAALCILALGLAPISGVFSEEVPTAVSFPHAFWHSSRGKP